MAGKVDIFCLDKTGTLTKDGLEFYGVAAGAGPPRVEVPRGTAQPPSASAPSWAAELARGAPPNQPGATPPQESSLFLPPSVERPRPSEGSSSSFDLVRFQSCEQFNTTLEENGHAALLFGLACCHTLVPRKRTGVVNEQLVGSPLEQEALRSVGWELLPGASSTAQGLPSRARGLPSEEAGIMATRRETSNTSEEPRSSEERGSPHRTHGSQDEERGSSTSDDPAPGAGEATDHEGEAHHKAEMTALLEQSFCVSNRASFHDAHSQRARVLRRWSFDPRLQLQVSLCLILPVLPEATFSAFNDTYVEVEEQDRMLIKTSKRGEETPTLTVFAKGSTEAVARLVGNTTRRYRQELTSTADAYSAQGLYTLAMAVQRRDDLAWDQIPSITLETLLKNETAPSSPVESQSNFEFLGLLLFKVMRHWSEVFFQKGRSSRTGGN